LALSSVHWREAWKYGERAYRYCQLDVGHALAALRLSAAIHGWQVELISACSDDQLESLIDLKRKADFDNVEKEKPDLLVTIGPANNNRAGYNIDALIERLHNDTARWNGQANLLDPAPLYQWPTIDDVSHACHKIVSEPRPENTGMARISIKLCLVHHYILPSHQTP